MTTKLYRLDKPDDTTGWMEVRNDEDYQPPIEWREATRREWLWRQLTKPRFSWLALAVILTAGAVVQIIWEAVT